jgi:tyrosine-protein kinase Etk/Wzc
VQETVYTLLTQQLEQAKIAEARDTPTVQTLDQAVPADRKSKPKIKLNIAIAGITSLLVGLLLAFFLEYLAGVKQSPLSHA